jgi:hypothetical protein
MRVMSRLLSICIIAVLLGAQWVAHMHRVEHRAGLANAAAASAFAQANETHATAGPWGHDALTAECVLYDALSCSDAQKGGAQPLFSTVALPTLFLLFLSAHVALRALRATARGPPGLI